MEPLPSLMLLALLLVPWGPAGGQRAPGGVPGSRCGAAGAAPGARGPFRDYRKVKPGSEFPWIQAYVPVRSCHRVLKDKSGEFSPPAYRGDSPINIWCSWTVWAGSRKHIIIYIQGFVTSEGCNKNEDKILFEGVSSLVESSVVYACWKKETHVFATFAQAVHVVLLQRYLPSCRDTQFKGKYYIFPDQEGKSSSKGEVTSETPAPKPPEQDSISQSGWVKDLRDVLGFATTRSMASLGRTMGAVAAGSPVELVPHEPARTPLLGTEAPGVLGSELPGGLSCCKEAQGRGKPGDIIIPTAVQDPWGQSSGYLQRLSGGLLETPSLGPLQVMEPCLQPAGMGLENRQSVLHPALRPKHLGDLQFAIEPTQVRSLNLAACSQSLIPGREESNEGADTTVHQGLSTGSLEKDEGHPQLSISTDGTVSSDADGLAMGLMPSLRSPYEVVNGDHSPLLPERSQSSLGGLSMAQPELGTTGLQHAKLMSISPLESFRGAVEGETVLQPIAPWDIFQEHPRLTGQGSHVLQSAPTGPGSLPQHAQAHDSSASEKACPSSLGVRSCHHQSDRAAQPRLVTPPLPTRLKHLPIAMSTLGTETTPTLVASCSEPVPADFGSTDFSPEARLPAEVGAMSRVVFSPPAALALDSISLRRRAGIPPASPGEHEMVSPSPPCHPSPASELGTDGSPRHLGPGMPKLVLGQVDGQRGETSASVSSMAGGPSPASVTVPEPGVGLPQPEDHVSSSSGVTPGTWGTRRKDHEVPAQHQGMAASNKPASAYVPGELKVQKTSEALRVGAGEQRNASSSTAPAHPHPPGAWWGETAARGQKLQEPSEGPVSRNAWVPAGQQQQRAEPGQPWAMQYLPISSCHLTFRDRAGMFHLPLHADVQTNIWCNWTIWAGPQKHILIYIQGFQGTEGCGENEDRLIFQGVSSSVETQVVYACHSRGTLIFAAQATAVHVLFLSGSGSTSSKYGHFKGQYYVFRDSEDVASSDDSRAPQEPGQEVSKKESWRTVVTKGSLPMLRTSPSSSAAPAGGRIQPELVSPDREAKHPPNLMENAQSGADLREHGQLWDETKLESSLEDGGGTEGRETKDDALVEPAPTGQDVGCKAEPSALETARLAVEPVLALVTNVPRHSVGGFSSEVPSSSVGVSAKPSSLAQAIHSPSGGVGAVAHLTQTPVLEEPLLHTSTKPSLSPFPGVAAGDPVSLGERNKELFDLVSALVALENDTALQSQHHPGDVLFEVTMEIKPKDWIPGGGSELQKGLLESMKNHIRENLRLSASRVSEIKLKEIRRTSRANLLLTFWLHLKPEERNMSLLLRSQLEELLGTSGAVGKLQLVSLGVEDVNECSAGVGLCGEDAECFNGVGTYLCRCKEGYEDHSPTKAGTLCIPAPRRGVGFFLRHADILVGAAIVAGLAMLVAAGALCRSARWGGHPRRNPNLEEPPAGAVEESVMELHDLEECLRLEPFQLKLRARPPEWLWGARANPSQAYQVFLEPSPQL